MKEILLINPRRSKPKKKRSGKQGVKAMAAKKKSTSKPRKRRKTTSAAPKRRRASTKRTTRRRRRRNPQSPKRAALNLLSAKSLFGMAADASKQFGGHLACQFAAKKFADGGGANENWGWKNYLFGLLGTSVAAYGAEMIKRGSGRDFMTGGLSYLMLKAFVGEAGPRFPWVETYFGDPTAYGYGTGLQGDDFPGQYLGTDGNYYTPGDSYYGEDGEVYLLGQDGMWRPTSDDYRNPELLGLGDGMVDRGSLGDSVFPVGPLGEDPYQSYFNRMGEDADPYSATFFRN
jgi:hypothetical protein